MAGIRLISRPTSDAEEAQAISYGAPLVDIISSSWGPHDDGRRLDGAGHLSQEVLESVVNGNPLHSNLHGRGGKGSIYIWASGNGGLNGDNCNYDSWANSRYTITVAAVGDNGKVAPYSEPCSAILVAGPSSGGRRGITTSFSGQTPGGCANSFGGTSAAAPSIAGLVALILEANPRVSWRDVQHILVRSSDLGGLQPDMQINGGAHIYSHSLGFGVPNAGLSVKLALDWELVGPNRVEEYHRTLDMEIRDQLSVSQCIDVTESFLVEHVEVIFSAQHSRRGDLEISLNGPWGVRSRLAELHQDTNANYEQWRFMSVAYWDSNSTGSWCLEVGDKRPGVSGRWLSWTLRVWGR